MQKEVVYGTYNEVLGYIQGVCKEGNKDIRTLLTNIIPVELSITETVRLYSQLKTELEGNLVIRVVDGEVEYLSNDSKTGIESLLNTLILMLN